MNQRTAELQMDDLLFPFLNAHSEAESEAILEELIVRHARPLIRDIIGFKLKASFSRRGDNLDRQEVEDVAHEVILRLIRRLREYKTSPQTKAISNLRSYIAVMAYNASDEHLRGKYPRRYSLKNKVRYILTHRDGLALWEGENRTTLCGLTHWSERQSSAAASLREGTKGLDDFLHARFPNTARAELDPVTLVTALLEFANAPLEIDELVTVMAEILGIRDARPRELEPENAGHGSKAQLSSDPRGMIDETFDRRARLKRVWDEILQLPARQRAALLLNLRDEGGGAAIHLLPLLRVATMRQIAAALELQAEELGEIWNSLPLEDAVIGNRLGATTQQVSNLRKCARERLARRLGPQGSR